MGDAMGGAAGRRVRADGTMTDRQNPREEGRIVATLGDGPPRGTEKRRDGEGGSRLWVA